MSDAFAAVASALRSAGSVVVCGHVNPDGDSIGSVIALTLALRTIGVEAVPTLADTRPLPPAYARLTGSDLFRQATELDAPDIFVAIDTPSPARLGVAEMLSQAAGTIVVIDHHADGTPYGDLDLIDAQAASVGTLIWRLLPELGVVPSADIAAACYVALMTDTGRFSYGNTTPVALREAAAMIEAGADAHRLYMRVYESRTAASLALLGRVLSRVTVANGGRVAYSWMTEDDLHETGAAPEEAENVIDIVRQTGRIDAAVLFRAQGHDVKVSLRAKCPTLDVGAIARSFGGGGHFAAAGATIAAPLEAAIESVLEVLPGAEA